MQNATTAGTNDRNVTRKKKSRDTIPEGYKLAPPDGNYAWIVAFACFIGGLCIMSSLSIFSVLLYDLIPLYNTNTATVSWIPSISIATGQFLGLVNAVIINTFGVRKSTVIGGLLMSFGMTTSYFVDRIELLCITYGCFIGFGVGMCHACYPVVLSQYFKKYYGVAVGLLAASYAGARLIFIPLAQYLQEQYGSRSVLLLIGATYLHIIAVGLLFQPVKRHLVLVPIDVDSKKLLVKENGNGDDNVYVNKNRINGKNGTKDLQEMIPLSVPTDKNSITTVKSLNDSVSMITTKDNRVCSNEHCCLSGCRKQICAKIDFSLLTEPCFYIVCAQDFLMLCLSVFGNIYLYALGIEKGLSPIQLAWIISAKAIVDIVCRVAGPWLITYFHLSSRKCFIFIGFVHGIVLAAILLVDSKSHLMIWGISSSIAFGSIPSLSRVLMIETMGVQRLASVMGLSSFIEGFFMLPMAPMLGWIRDTTGSFVNIYLVLAMMQFILITLWIIQPLLPQKPITF